MGKEVLDPKDSKAVFLPRLQGKWPTYDLPRDHLELYAEVNVYECSMGTCQKETCGTITSGSVQSRDPIGTDLKRSDDDTVIYPGESGRIIIEQGTKAAGAAADKAFKSALPRFPRVTRVALAALDDRVSRLEERALKQGVVASADKARPAKERG